MPVAGTQRKPLHYASKAAPEDGHEVSHTCVGERRDVPKKITGAQWARWGENHAAVAPATRKVPVKLQVIVMTA